MGPSRGLLRDEDWAVVLRRIRDGRCTPFLGAGACYGVLPLGADIAKDWAVKNNYPLHDDTNLMSVAQFLALKYSDAIYPKDLIVERFEGVAPPDFADPTEPHRVLAGLPIRTYITTNYDDFMSRALRIRHREPQRILCQWNRAVKDYVKDNPTILEKQPDYKPNVANPLVFHLHGHVPVSESLVLTEDDYMDFLVNISRDAELIPKPIARALSGDLLLFIGYRITDWNFRVLLKGFSRYVESSISHLNVAVMRPPSAGESTQEKVQDYLTKYYQNMDVRMYWGTARDFARELQERWDASGYAT